METKKKNPILAGLITLLPNLVTTVSSIIKDKRDKKQAEKEDVAHGTPYVTTGETIVDSLKEAVTGDISSKRVLNIGGFGLIVSIAVSDIGVHGITKQNLVLVGLGIAYSLGMSLITWLSERK